MHIAKSVKLKDSTIYENLRVMDSDESLLLFMEGEDGKEFIRMVPWDNVSYIDYDDTQALKHIKAVATMAMLDAMDDVEDFIAEVGDLDRVLVNAVSSEEEEVKEDETKLTKNPYGE